MEMTLTVQTHSRSGATLKPLKMSLTGCNQDTKSPTNSIGVHAELGNSNRMSSFRKLANNMPKPENKKTFRSGVQKFS